MNRIADKLKEVMAVADRVVVMRGGKISGELSREEATEQSVMKLASFTSDAEV